MVRQTDMSPLRLVPSKRKGGLETGYGEHPRILLYFRFMKTGGNKVNAKLTGKLNKIRLLFGRTP